MTTSFTSRQLVNNYEILVTRTEFLVALATRKAQFRTLSASIGFTNTYLLDSAIHRLNNQGLVL